MLERGELWGIPATMANPSEGFIQGEGVGLPDRHSRESGSPGFQEIPQAPLDLVLGPY